MEEDAITFVKQMIRLLERDLEKLFKAKEENDPRKFNDIKKRCMDTQKQIEDLIK